MYINSFIIYMLYANGMHILCVYVCIVYFIHTKLRHYMLQKGKNIYKLKTLHTTLTSANVQPQTSWLQATASLTLR